MIHKSSLELIQSNTSMIKNNTDNLAKILDIENESNRSHMSLSIIQTIKNAKCLAGK